MIKNYMGAFLLASLLISSRSYGQYAADALRYSEINQTGSARFQALGGNHASLGGDPSTISGNPAGLGFYSRSELTVTPGLTSIGTKTSYIDRTSADSKVNGNLAQASLVITSQPDFQRKWKRSSLGISFSRQQSFQDVYNFGARNPTSSYLDNVVERAGGTPVSQLEADFESSPTNGGPIAYSLPAAYYQMYLISPTAANGERYVPVDAQSVVDQTGSYNATGANTQWTLAYAGNLNDKFYLGANVGFNRIRYKYSRLLQDDYVNSQELIYIDQSEDLRVSGNGINASLGMIYKFNPTVQIGATIISPTLTAIRETFSQSVAASYVDGQVSGPDGTLITPPYTQLPIAPNDFEYTLVSPFRANAGATFFFQDKGFITGTLEYVGYSGMRVRTNFLSSADNANFRNDTKNEIVSMYRNTVNARLGAEVRANMLRFRIGGAYLADPNINRDVLDQSKYLVSAGIGFRSSRFFADLGGVMTMYKSEYTPYTLSDVRDYYYAQTTHRPLNVTLTLGMNF